MKNLEKYKWITEYTVKILKYIYTKYVLKNKFVNIIIKICAGKLKFVCTLSN